MATYPVKLLIDKNGTAFIPVVNSDSIITPDGDTLDDLLDEKQDTLVSGTNLKTINNQSLLGSGNITIEGGGTVNTYYLVNILNMTSTSDATYEIVNDLINNNQFVIFDDPDGRSRELFCYVPIKTYYQSDLDIQTFWYIDNQDKYNLVVITHSGTSVTVIRTTYHSIEEAYNLADGKQNALVSGTNIKTINNESILGSGNISISGGSATDVQVNGTSITSSGVANLLTNSAYNSSSNKIATMSDIPEKQTFKISDILALSSTDTIWNDFLDCVENKKEFNVESGTVTTGRKTYEIIGTYFKKSSALLKIYYIDEDNIINEISVSYAMPSSKIVTQTTFTPLSISKVKTTTSTTSGDVYDVTYINTMLGDIESLLGGI